MSKRPTDEDIENLIRRTLEEDLGPGDITTDSTVRDDSVRVAEVIAKEPLVLCGVEIFRRVFSGLDENADFPCEIPKDGSAITAGTIFLRVQARCTALLKGERTALNILQHLSGIATLTRQYVEKAGPVTILDTRKTTPGLRVFDKYAVHSGGGENHRFGLFDGILIKDNHILAAGNITEAVQRVRNKCPKPLPVEVETKTLAEVKEALSAGSDIIMLDNMPLDMVHEAVKLIAKKAKIEVSGSMSLDTVEKLSGSGVDHISVGALTHSARAVDISMNFSKHENI